MLTIWGCEVIKNRLFTSSKLSPLRTSAMSCAPLTIPCSRQILLSPSVYPVRRVPGGMFVIYFPMQKNWFAKAFRDKRKKSSWCREEKPACFEADFPSFLWGSANNWPTSPPAFRYWRCGVVAPSWLDWQTRTWRKRQLWIMDEALLYCSVCCLLCSMAAFVEHCL